MCLFCLLPFAFLMVASTPSLPTTLTLRCSRKLRWKSRHSFFIRRICQLTEKVDPHFSQNKIIIAHVRAGRLPTIALAKVGDPPLAFREAHEPPLHFQELLSTKNGRLMSRPYTRHSFSPTLPLVN